MKILRILNNGDDCIENYNALNLAFFSQKNDHVNYIFLIKGNYVVDFVKKIL